MGNSQTPDVNSAPAEKKQCELDSCKLEQKPKTEKKLKACCACPETKKARDACIMEKGEENCKDLIEAHKECMRKLGFNV